MRNLINMITEMQASDVAHIIQNGLENNATYLGRFQGNPGDGIVSEVVMMLHNLGIDPKLVKIGNKVYSEGELDGIFNGGVVILDIRGNIEMHIGKRKVDLENMIVDAGQASYPVSIIIVEYGPSQFSHEVVSLFPDLDVTGLGNKKIDDGGIHRIV
jgi:hypothetical protein